MYHIAFCEDHEEFIQYLERVILKAGMTKQEVQFYEFLNGESLVAYLERENAKCDLLILDMQLPGMSGDEVAECFRKRFPNTILVFCSGTTKPTDRSFKAMAFRYLYKEYTDERMLEEIKEIIEKMITHKVKPVLLVHHYHKQLQLKLDEILYIELARRGSKIHVCPNVDVKDIHGDLLSNEKLSDLYEVLRDFGFEYAHNSYIVNLKYVHKITYSELLFVKWENEEKEQRLNVSRSRVKELRKSLARELGSKY